MSIASLRLYLEQISCEIFALLLHMQVEDEIIDAMLHATDRDGDGQISIKVPARAASNRRTVWAMSRRSGE